MNEREKDMREKLKRRIARLAVTKFAKSIAPASDIAGLLKDDLLAAGIPNEDHLLAVLNMMPRSPKTKLHPKPTEVVVQSKFGNEELTKALTESLILQSHYANLLNWHDGGKRMTFANVREWVARLRKIGTFPKKPIHVAESDGKLVVTGTGIVPQDGCGGWPPQ
jgi:hypothetical protein